MRINTGKIRLFFCIVAVSAYADSSITLASNTYECKSTTLIELYTNECGECPACPSVRACGEGYSCQPDTHPGEVQQYPPEPGEAWVNSIVPVSTLTDVTLNDARWKEREVGEVYARENKDFIVWYWPNGGDAIFDTTSLGKSHKWYDYTYRTGKSNSGNAVTSNTKLPILFHNPSGISIFERAGTTPGSVCTEFLAEYTNPEQVKLPANRVYPMGQKMMLTAWLGKSAGDLAKMKRHGFTMQGPEWNTMNLSYLDTAISKGLRSAHRIIDGPTNAHELNKVYKDGKQEAMFRNLRSRVRKITRVPKYNNNVDIWLTGVEELSTHIGDGDWNVTLAVATDYLKRLKQIVKEEDSQQRPLWMSDVTGVSKSQMMVTQRYLDMVGPQVYLERICQTCGYKTDAVMGGIARMIVHTQKDLDSSSPMPRQRPATASLGLIYEPIPARSGRAAIDKITANWMYQGFNNGLNGYQFYAWHKYGDISQETWGEFKNAYSKHVKELTDNKLDYVYLWGDRRKDLSLKILSGPEKIHGYPSISMANIQYGKHRYVMLTNSGDEAVQVEVSGFPKDCVKTLDIHTGKHSKNHDSVNLMMQPLDVRLFRFDSVMR